MKNIEIKIFKETRMVELNKFIIGNDGENLQGNLVFTFDEFVDGQARLEYVIDGEKNYIILEKVDETYQVPILSVITKKGQIDMQVVVTQGTEDIAIFKSNLFYLTCNASINAEIEQPDEYLQWIEVANAKLNEVDNLDIDAVKENGIATITITKKDGTQQSVNLFDAEGAVTNYELLENLPSINGVELTGNKSLDELNIQEKGDYLTNETDPVFKRSASYGITNQDINNWNNKSEFSGNYDDLNGKPTIPTKTSELTNNSGFITEIPSEYITETELNEKGYLTEHQDISGKQDKLISGETIKTINNQSLLGSGNITITSESGTTDYNALENRPKINNITLSGNKTLDELGIQPKGDYVKETDLQDVLQDYAKSDEIPDISGKQDTLVSGTNIKTINGNSILGSGNIEIQGGGSGITEIPIASANTLGGIKVGTNLSITADGTLNAISSGSGSGGDTLPINAIVRYDGTTVPEGYVEVQEETRSIITAYLSGNQNFTSDARYYEGDINLIEFNKCGSKLTMEGTAVKIGSGVSKVLISAQMGVYTQTAGALYGVVVSATHIDETKETLARSIWTAPTGSKFDSYSPSNILIDVSEGDLIKMAVYIDNSSVSITIAGGTGFPNTYLTVDVVE